MRKKDEITLKIAEIMLEIAELNKMVIEYTENSENQPIQAKPTVVKPVVIETPVEKKPPVKQAVIEEIAKPQQPNGESDLHETIEISDGRIFFFPPMPKGNLKKIPVIFKMQSDDRKKLIEDIAMGKCMEKWRGKKVTLINGTSYVFTRYNLPSVIHVAKKLKIQPVKPPMFLTQKTKKPATPPVRIEVKSKKLKLRSGTEIPFPHKPNVRPSKVPVIFMFHDNDLIDFYSDLEEGLIMKKWEGKTVELKNGKTHTFNYNGLGVFVRYAKTLVPNLIAPEVSKRKINSIEQPKTQQNLIAPEVSKRKINSIEQPKTQQNPTPSTIPVFNDIESRGGQTEVKTNLLAMRNINESDLIPLENLKKTLEADLGYNDNSSPSLSRILMDFERPRVCFLALLYGVDLHRICHFLKVDPSAPGFASDWKRISDRAANINENKPYFAGFLSDYTTMMKRANLKGKSQ